MIKLLLIIIVGITGFEPAQLKSNGFTDRSDSPTSADTH